MKQALEDIRKRLANAEYKNEEHVRLSLVARVLQELGWNLWNPSEVNSEFKAVPTEDYSRVDLALFLTPYSPSVYVEVKAIGRLQGDIRQLETQLRDYNRNNTAVFSIITDGRHWRFYYSQTGGEFSKKCFKILDLIDDDLDELESSFNAFLSKNEISNGNAKRDAENYLQLSQKQRAMEDVLPQAHKMVSEPPYPRLPEAIVQLVTEKGLSITIEEATQFKQEFDRRKPTPEPTSSLQPSTPVSRTLARSSDIPMALAHVLDVCQEVFNNGKDYTEARKIVSKRKGLTGNTVPSSCTRSISTKRVKVDAAKFRYLLQNKSELVEHLVKKFPKHEGYIRQALS